MIQEGTFQIYQTDRSAYSWSLLEEEGEIIAHAPGQYETIADSLGEQEKIPVKQTGMERSIGARDWTG